MTVTALWTNPTQVIRKQDSETEIEIFSDPRDWGHEQARYILFRSVTAKILQNRLAQPLNYEAYVSSWGCFITKPQHKVVLTDLFYPGKCLPIKAISEIYALAHAISRQKWNLPYCEKIIRIIIIFYWRDSWAGVYMR